MILDDYQKAELDLEYIHKISPSLEKFKFSNGGFLCRCLYCGDSQKSEWKVRGSFFNADGSWFYHCFNCGVSVSIQSFLRTHFPNDYNDYIFDLFGKNSNSNSKKKNIVRVGHSGDAPKIKDPRNVLSKFRIASSLDENDNVRKYLHKRLLDKNLDEIYVADDMSKFWSEYSNKESHDHSTKVVLPIFNRYNDLIGLQARHIDTSVKERMKYKTASFNKTYPNVWGLNKIDETKTVYVVEGIIDAMMLDNTIASISSALMQKTQDVLNYHTELFQKDKKKFVLIYDNEPYNKDIVKQMQRTINAGFTVAIWKHSFKFKDINEAMIAGEKDIFKHLIITNNNLENELNFVNWKN